MCFALSVLLIPSLLIPPLGLGYLYRQSLRSRIHREFIQIRQETRWVQSRLETVAMEALIVGGLPETRALANASTPGKTRAAVENLRDRIKTYMIRNGDYIVAIKLADVSGNLLVNLGSREPASNQADRPWFTGANHLAAIRGKKTPVYYSHAGPGHPVRFSTVVENDQGLLFGVLCLEMDLNGFIRALPEPRPGATYVLLDEQGERLAEYPEKNVPSLRGVDLETVLRQRSGVIPPASWFPDSIRAHTRIQPAAQSRIRWTLISEIPLTGLSTAFAKTLLIGLAATLAALLMALAVASRLSRQLSAPVLRLAEAADDVAHGHWDTRAPESAPLPREIRQLGQAFNSMCRQLKTSQQALLKNVEHLRSSEEQLSRESRRLSVLLQSIGDAVVAVDLEGRIQLANPAAEQLLDREPETCDGRFLGEFATFIDPESEEDITAQVANPDKSDMLASLGELRLVDARDREYRIEHTLAPVRLEDKGLVGQVLVLRDVTRARALAEERDRLERMESLAVLAGGIAHDFNNLLAVILGDLSLLSIHIRENKNTELLDHAQEATRRARDLTRQLMTFSKGGMPIKESASVRKIVEEAARLVLRGTAVDFHITAEEGLSGAEVDPGQIHQVFHNLLLNASQAMPGGGEIHTHLANADLAGENEWDLPAGPYLEITVEDDGPGIPSHHLPHVFDPYYTTKELGHGLGLSSAHRIVTSHGGHIDVASSGEGTRFTLFLPAQSSSPEKPPPRKDTPHASRVPPSRILILDDDPGIRHTCGILLKHLGHEVETTSEGEETLQAYHWAREQGTPFDLLLLDLTIPGGKGGQYVAGEIRKRDGDTKLVVSSGYSQDEVMARYREFGFDGMIRKPYSLRELEAVLEATLLASSSNPPSCA